MKTPFKTAMLLTALVFGSASLSACAGDGMLGDLGFGGDEQVGFDELDTNDDGLLTQNEFGTEYDEQQFSELDGDADGLLSEDEFLEL